MFKERYMAMLGGISPASSLVDGTIDQMNELVKQKNSRTKPFYRKPLTYVAAALLCVLLATPVLAANVPAIYELMYLVSPSVAQFFMPVQEACEYNGIRMEVISTYIHEDTAEIYVTLQDLTGDRVDATTDLYDSYEIHRPFDSTAHCERVGYDSNTKTATFLIEITEWGDHSIQGDKMTFSVGCFLSHKQKYEGIPINIDLSNVNINPETEFVYSNGGGGIQDAQYDDDGRAKVLVPGEKLDFPVDGIDLTGIGYVDGMLHIQTSVINNLKKDNHGYFVLKDQNGNEIRNAYSVYFTEYLEQGNEETRITFVEYVFDIPQEDIADYSLYGTFWTSGLYTEGFWQVTFPLQKETDQ